MYHNAEDNIVKCNLFMSGELLGSLLTSKSNGEDLCKLFKPEHTED